MCPEVRSIEQAGRIAQRVLEGFHKPVWIDGGEYPVSVSIGIAIAAQPDPGAAADLVRDADAAMYRAKAAGRGRYMLFDDELRHQVLARLDTEHALHAALHAEQFVVHYQPLVDAEAGTLVELEALLRWNRPGVGLVAPGQFLAVAEDAGLLSMIGDVVLAEAVGQAARWVELRRGMTPIPVSVNIADHHIVDPDFVEKVERVLDEHGLDPSLLTLELSEDLVIERLQPTLGVLRDLRRVGVTLAIDDFGTGRSSLWLLEQLTMVSVLKIDRSFVDPLPGSAPNRAIIKAVVAMAPTLGMRVVAEGVETVGQVEVLRDLGGPDPPGLPLQPSPAGGGARPAPAVRRGPLRGPAPSGCSLSERGRRAGTRRRRSSRSSLAPWGSHAGHLLDAWSSRRCSPQSSSSCSAAASPLRLRSALVTGRWRSPSHRRGCSTRAAHPFGPIGVPAAGPLGARSQIELTLAGLGPVPSDAVGVILNVTALDSTAASFVTVWPADGARPNASTLNPQPGDTVFNSAVIDLSDAGSIAIYNENGSTELIVDVTGYTVGHHHDDRYASKITVVSTMVSTTLNPGNAIGVHIPCPAGTVAIAGGIDYFPAAVRRLDGYPTAPPDTVPGPMWVEQLYNDSGGSAGRGGDRIRHVRRRVDGPPFRCRGRRGPSRRCSAPDSRVADRRRCPSAPRTAPRPGRLGGRRPSSAA